MILFILPNKIIYGEEAYFDLSDQEIEIQTNFNGKEVIIFGLTEPQYDTLITIKGPNKDTKISKKERIFGFWFHTKKITYRNLPSIFFVASTSPIKKILPSFVFIANSPNAKSDVEGTFAAVELLFNFTTCAIWHYLTIYIVTMLRSIYS